MNDSQPGHRVSRLDFLINQTQHEEIKSHRQSNKNSYLTADGVIQKIINKNKQKVVNNSAMYFPLYKTDHMKNTSCVIRQLYRIER